MYQHVRTLLLAGNVAAYGGDADRCPIVHCAKEEVGDAPTPILSVHLHALHKHCHFYLDLLPAFKTNYYNATQYSVERVTMTSLHMQA